jgi:CubicO group peptidase (beta-lactamase class C family)
MPALPCTVAAWVLAGACTPDVAPERAPQPTTPVRHFPADEDLRVMLRYLVEDGATPGIVLGIVEADGSTRILSHGSAGPGARPLGPRSVFEIGSITKTFTGTILADMVARGEVSLSDPVSKHLPAGVRVPSRGGREITLLDLATHRSGLPRMPGNFSPANLADPYADYTVERLYAFLAHYELSREIGSEREYSNVGMGLLGHALGRAAGIDADQLTRTRILEPLGMRMTGFVREGEVAEWMVKGHDAAGRVVPYWEMTDAIRAAGGLRSNLEDMLVYLRANMGPADTDLERAMRQAHQARHPPEGGLSNGLGWLVREHEGRTIITHDGGTAGFHTSIGFDPEKRVGYVMLANSGAMNDDIGMDFLLRGPPPAIPDVAVARDVLAAYAGRYELSPGWFITVKLEADGRLTLRTPETVRLQMYPETDSSFYLMRNAWRVTFTKDASGEITGLNLNMHGMERPARRVGRDQPPPTSVSRARPYSRGALYSASVSRRTRVTLPRSWGALLRREKSRQKKEVRLMGCSRSSVAGVAYPGRTNGHGNESQIVAEVVERRVEIIGHADQTLRAAKLPDTFRG